MDPADALRQMVLDMAVALAGPSHGVYNGPGPFHGTCF